MRKNKRLAVWCPVELCGVDAQFLRSQFSNSTFARSIFGNRHETEPDRLQVLINDAPVSLFLLGLFLSVTVRLRHTESDLSSIRRPSQCGNIALLIGELFRFTSCDSNAPDVSFRFRLAAACRQKRDPLPVR